MSVNYGNIATFFPESVPGEVYLHKYKFFSIRKTSVCCCCIVSNNRMVFIPWWQARLALNSVWMFVLKVKEMGIFSDSMNKKMSLKLSEKSDSSVYMSKDFKDVWQVSICKSTGSEVIKSSSELQ